MKQYYNSNISYIDMLMNVAMIFALLFMVAIILMNDPQQNKQKVIDEKSKILIVMTWDDQSSDDMDLWLKTPEPAKIGYDSANGNIANLARDDLGSSNDQYTENGQVHYTRLNKEVISIRQKMEGHYVVNAYFYARQLDPERHAFSIGPQNVVVQVIQIDPSYKEIVTQTLTLDIQSTREKTAVMFDIDHGQIVNVDTTSQDLFVGEQLEGSPEQAP